MSQGPPFARLRRALEEPELDAGRYVLHEVLGHGGMGTVYRADDRVLGREVALKVVHVEAAEGPALDRLRAEARILARLEHPGIVPVHELGTLPDGRVYYTMKRVRGRTLREHLQQDRPLSERLRLFLRIAEAVAFAHAAGVWHRDLKPGNVMVGEFGEVLVMDWGVAHLARDGEPAPHAVVGTPEWMAPEQAQAGTPADALADVWGLGALLSALLLGGPPGEATERARRYPELRVPRPLRSVLERALARVPGERYASAEALAAEVRRFLDEQPVLAHRAGVLEQLGRFLRRHALAVTLIVAYLLLRTLLWAFLQR